MNIRHLSLSVIVFALFSCSESPKVEVAETGIIPQPGEMTRGQGDFMVSGTTSVGSKKEPSGKLAA